MSLGSRLKEVRKKRKMSQEELGSSIGITRAAISQIEDGKTKKTKHIRGLASVLGVSAAWLEYGENNIENMAFELTDSEIEVISMFRRLNESDKQALLKISRGLIGLTYGENTHNK